MRVLFIFVVETKNFMNYFNLFTRSLLCCMLVLSVAACKKTDPPDNNEYLLMQTYKNGVLTYSYTYNDSAQLIRSAFDFEYGPHDLETRTTSFSYNSAGQLTQSTAIMSRNNPSNFVTDYRSEYTYNSLGQLVLVKTYKLNTGELYNADEYAYNGKTIVNTHTYNSSVEYTKTYTLDDKGNIVKAVTENPTSGGPMSTEQWLDYDDKKNIEGPVVGNVASKNNPRRYTKVVPNYSPDTDESFEYTYNRAGYVTQRIYSGGDTTKYVWKVK